MDGQENKRFPQETYYPSARDALIAELLGDVGKLSDKIDQLRNALPIMVDDVSMRLNQESSRFISSAEDLGLVLERIASYVDAHAEKTVSAEVDKVKVELRTSLQGVASDALKVAIGQEIVPLLQKIDDSAISFNREVKNTSKVINSYQSGSSNMRLLMFGALSAMLGAGAALSLFIFMFNK